MQLPADAAPRRLRLPGLSAMSMMRRWPEPRFDGSDGARAGDFHVEAASPLRLLRCFYAIVRRCQFPRWSPMRGECLALTGLIARRRLAATMIISPLLHFRAFSIGYVRTRISGQPPAVCAAHHAPPEICASAHFDERLPPHQRRMPEAQLQRILGDAGGRRARPRRLCLSALLPRFSPTN